jgi:hypothetical protein
VCWHRFFYLYLPLGSLHQHFTLCLFCSENQSSSFLFFSSPSFPRLLCTELNLMSSLIHYTTSWCETTSFLISSSIKWYTIFQYDITTLGSFMLSFYVKKLSLCYDKILSESDCSFPLLFLRSIFLWL